MKRLFDIFITSMIAQGFFVLFLYLYGGGLFCS